MKRSHYPTCVHLLFALAAVFACCTERAPADTVILKNKSRFEGRVLVENDRKVVIETGYGTITFKRSTVQKVTRENWTLPPKKTATYRWKPSISRKSRLKTGRSLGKLGTRCGKTRWSKQAASRKRSRMSQVPARKSKKTAQRTRRRVPS